MLHTHCTRINTHDGTKSFVAFGEIDGMQHDWKYYRAAGYRTREALLIVNRWNYIAQLTYRNPEYIYYLHTADGAS